MGSCKEKVQDEHTEAENFVLKKRGVAKLAEEGRFGQQPSKGKRRRLQKRFARAAGAGRKRELSREISQLGEWLKKERSCSHNVSKNELLKELGQRDGQGRALQK